MSDEDKIIFKPIIRKKKYSVNFLNLPILLQIHILSYLNGKTLLTVSSIYSSIFYHDNNMIWKIHYNRINTTKPLKSLNPVSWGYCYLKHINSLCYRCCKKTVSLHPIYLIPTCRPCLLHDAGYFKIISLNKASHTYLLSPSKISSVHAHFNCGSMSGRYFCYLDIIKEAMNKWGTIENIKEEREREKIKREEKRKQQEERRKEIEERRKQTEESYRQIKEDINKRRCQQVEES